MSDHPASTTRRTFLKGAGTAAAATALGASATGAASADAPTFEERFANPRVQEAAKVWKRGYRGDPERTVALDDSGIDVAHPDLGPWNGLTAVARDAGDGDGRPEIDLATEPALERWDASRTAVPVDATTEQTAVLGPGTTVEGSRTTFPPFTPPEGEGIVQLDATLSWTPPNQALPVAAAGVSSAGEDQSFTVEINRGTPEAPDWVTLQTIDTGSNPEELSRVPVVPGTQHRFVAGQFANVAARGTVSWEYFGFERDLATRDAEEVFDVSGLDRPPKTVGWFDAGDRYGQSFSPTDPQDAPSDGHGSHVSGIMAGSGRASSVDPDTYLEDDPRTVLAAGDVLTYEVEADPGTGVFGVATGEGVEVVLEGPEGRQLRTSGTAALVSGDKEALPVDDARVDHPTVDDRHPTAGGEPRPATYRVIVRPAGGEVASTGRVQEVAAGSFLDPADGDAGDRTAGTPSMHAGVAPDQGLFGMQGLSGPAASLALFGDELVDAFNVRAVNMSWGGLVPGGGSLGASATGEAISAIADSGVLTVAAAGNSFGTPATMPALADEAVAVAATNYVDGVTAYTSGGSAVQDEDGEGSYTKPDVCAPGGSYEAGARSVRARAAGGYPGESDGVRDYVNFPGTSMASPYVAGVAALLAEAMERDAPDSIALPEPTETGAEDVLRLKSVLLATASTTAFTAAPYHRHPVSYVHDGRDLYEGYGRVNPDAAVDAVTVDLFEDADVDGRSRSATVSGRAGLDVPGDPRAFAGHVTVPDGRLEVSVSHTHYSGGNRGMAAGAPHLDLFVYDAESPGQGASPATLASTQAAGGSGSVTVDVAADRDDRTTSEDEADVRTLFVVVKLVNVPGVVNGYDVRTNFDVDLAFEGSGPLPLPTFSAGGSRSDDGSVFTQGQTDAVSVTVESFSEGVTAVAVTDEVPPGWTVQPYGDVATDEPVEGPTTVDLGTVSRGDLGTDAATREYFVEATGSTGRYTFGPAAATIEATRDDAAFREGDDGADEFGGTDTNTVVGVSSEPDV